MDNKTKEFRQNIADIFIKSLSENKLYWAKKWSQYSTSPQNATTMKQYKGINRFALTIIAFQNGYKDPRWATFKQIQDKGWKLQKGSKGSKIEYWMPYDIKQKALISWDEYNKRQNDENLTFIAKYYTVFNAENIEGIPKLEITKNNITQDELITKLSNNMNVIIVNDGGNRAYYAPLEDRIHLPKMEYFADNYSYNSTALHELAHSTGSASRLNRNISNLFGSEDYAYEELIAEISSCFMSADLQMKHDENHINNHKAYIQSWIQAIKDKPDTLIKAIKEAEKTANYMEYKAELICEKDYNLSLGYSMEVQDNTEEKNTKKSLNEVKNSLQCIKNTINKNNIDTNEFEKGKKNKDIII